jgi:hypothetical protein
MGCLGWWRWCRQGLQPVVSANAIECQRQYQVFGGIMELASIGEEARRETMHKDLLGRRFVGSSLAKYEAYG